MHQSIKKKIKEIHQENILKYWDSLTTDEQKDLENQIEKIDIQTFNTQRKQIYQSKIIKEMEITPFQDVEIKGSFIDVEMGKKLIAEGLVGCLILAGGQGSRLGYNDPKGMFPVSNFKNKSLFQLYSERVLAAGRQVNQKLLLAVMTSSINHKEIIHFFEKNHFFGLDFEQVFFFSQDNLPFLDCEANLFLETPSKIAAGPNGNAPLFKHFVEKGIWSDWYQRGIRYLNTIQVDNPLADPYDAELIGFHHRHCTDLVIKCIAREDPLEKLGVILKKNGLTEVIEYTEITAEERTAILDNGKLKHECGNIGLFSFKMDFVNNVATKYYHHLPFHLAWKAVKYLNFEGKTCMAENPMAWKFEKFIFDLLPFANSVKALLYPREECFAPLKNAEGTDSIETVRVALQQNDRSIFRKITGNDPGLDSHFELDPQFYYPTEELLKKWKGKKLPNKTYIESGVNPRFAKVNSAKSMFDTK